MKERSLGAREPGFPTSPIISGNKKKKEITEGSTFSMTVLRAKVGKENQVLLPIQYLTERSRLHNETIKTIRKNMSDASEEKTSVNK